MSSSASGLALFLKLDEFVGGKVADSSGNSRDGVLQGDPQLIPDDEYGSCLTFDGQDDFVTLPAMEIDFSNGMTVSACVYYSRFSDWSRILDIGNGPSGDNIVLANFATSGTLILEVYRGGKVGALSAQGALVTGKWFHVAATVDRDSNAALYVEGREVARGQVPPPLNVARQSNFLGKSNWPENSLFQGRLANIRLYNRVLSENELLLDKQEDHTARASFALTYPVEFDLYDDDDQPVLYIDNAAGHNLHFDVTNTSRQTIDLAEPAPGAAVSPANHHFELRFRPQALSQVSLGRLAVQDGEWTMSQARQSDGTVSLYFLSSKTRAIAPGKSLQLLLQQVAADGDDGARGTRVELNYGQMNYHGDVTALTGTRIQHLSIVNASGHKNLPLHIGFLGSNKILNENDAPNQLTLMLTNVMDDHAISLNPSNSQTPSKFILSFDSKDKQDWSLGTPGEVASIQVSGDGWTVMKHSQEQPIEWVLTTSKSSLAAGEQIPLILSNIRSSKPSGYANIYLHYENIPGYVDGQMVCAIEKGPVIYKGARIGIGTVDPQAKLQVMNGAIMPSVGGTEASGIMFAKDPVSGKGDAAWLRYYPGQSESMNLELGVANHPDDNLVLTASGGIGLGTSTPTAGTRVTVSSSSNHLQLRREPTEKTGGKILFLELSQPNVTTSNIPDVHPSIRFSHDARFWSRIEGQPGGFHFKDGNMESDDYVSVYARGGYFGDNVGVGTRTPGANLSVVGSMSIIANDFFGFTHQDKGIGGLVTQAFQGGLEQNQSHFFKLLTLPDHRSAHVEVVAVFHDVVSNTHRLFYKAEFGWFRQGKKLEKEPVLASYSKATNPQLYFVDTIADGNDIQVKVSQGGQDISSVFHVVTRHMMVSAGD